MPPCTTTSLYARTPNLPASTSLLCGLTAGGNWGRLVFVFFIVLGTVVRVAMTRPLKRVPRTT
eukprot:3582407-Pyramimonas_sp.AAC.1